MRNFILSFLYALIGIVKAFKEQRNVRIQLCCAIAAIAAGFYFNILIIEWIVIFVMIALVLALELINTAIENLVNLVTTERLPLAGKIKDIAAGAVLIAASVSIIVGFLIFAKYFS